MKDPTWVPRVAILAAHLEQLREHGGRHGVRDLNGFDAALARPLNRNAYDEASDAAALAASYAFGLARGHCFVDGNKRIALASALMFLELNGYELSTDVTDDELAATIVATASGTMDEQSLAAWFRARLTSIPRQKNQARKQKRR